MTAAKGGRFTETVAVVTAASHLEQQIMQPPPAQQHAYRACHNLHNS